MRWIFASSRSISAFVAAMSCCSSVFLASTVERSRPVFTPATATKSSTQT